MVRCALLAGMLLAACGGSRGGGPAWPGASPADTDGGESLAPRQASAVAAIEEAEDATPSPPVAIVVPITPAAPAAAAKPDKPTSPETPAAKDDVLTTEEIIIEIED